MSRKWTLMKPVKKEKHRMNKVETRYAEYLETLKATKQIVGYKFEPFGLRLAEEKCYYHPDFLVVYEDRFEIHEVKAFNKKAGAPLVKDDALVKVKVASANFGFWAFKICWFDTNEGMWDYKTLK